MLIRDTVSIVSCHAYRAITFSSNGATLTVVASVDDQWIGVHPIPQFTTRAPTLEGIR